LSRIVALGASLRMTLYRADREVDAQILNVGSAHRP
jgi:hypothetical protein